MLDVTNFTWCMNTILYLYKDDMIWNVTMLSHTPYLSEGLLLSASTHNI